MRVKGLISRCGFLAAAVVPAVFVSGAWAEGPQDRWWGELEYFYPNIRSTARLDTAGGRGTTINLEDELSLSNRKSTPYLLLGTRFGERWRMEFEYYSLRRSSTKTIDRDITWGDVTFPVGGQVSTTFDSDIYRLTGGYSFYKTEQAEAGVGFGFHVTDFTTKLSGQGTGPAGLAFQTSGHNVLAPLPTIGLYGNYMVSNQWILRGRVDYLSLNYNEYDGRLVNWFAGADWRFAKNWGVGIGYRYVNYTVGVTKTNFNGEVTYKFSGPTFYVNAAF